MTGGEPDPGARPGGRDAVWLLLPGLALVAGVALRAIVFGQSLVGDELSTLWIVQGRSAGEVIDIISSDAEISPPLPFLLAWLTEKAWSVPEAVRIPALVAGVGLLPMIWLLARELFDRRVAGAAMSIASVAPILIYFSAYGRGYSLMLFFLATSTWAMLRASREEKCWWWVLYAFAAAGALYSHYTGVYFLAGQLGWLLFTRPAARRAAILATLGAALLYLPWLGGFIADSDSPTTPLLAVLQGQGITARIEALEQLVFWEIRTGAWSLGGRLDVWLIVAGAFACLAGLAIRGRNVRKSKDGRTGWLPSPELGLVLVLCLVTIGGTLLTGLLGTDTFGGRNLAATWIGLVLLGGFALVRAGRTFGSIALVLILAGLLTGSAHLADPDRTEFRYRDAAAFIDGQARPGDVIVDNSHITPTPLTPLGAYLESEVPSYPLNMPEGNPPFLASTPVPDPAIELDEAFADAGRSDHGRVFVVTLVGAEQVREGELAVGFGKIAVPSGWKAVEQRTFEGILPLTVTVFEPAPKRDAGG